MKHKILYTIFPVFIPWVSFWNQHGATISDMSKYKVAVSKDCSKIDEKNSNVFDAIIAKSNASREKGLGGIKEPLRPSDAMLFVFDRASKVTFWMKDTLIPLQILYFNEKGKLTQSLEMPVEKDPNDPKKLYPSKKNTIVALEVAPKSIRSIKGKQLCIEKINSQ